MHRSIITLLSLTFTLLAYGQTPAEWIKYSNDTKYISHTSTAYGEKGLTQERLVERAIKGLAQQMEVRVASLSQKYGQIIDGYTHNISEYNTILKTDVTLKLVGTESNFNASTGCGSAIAYINKKEAVAYYNAEVETLLSLCEQTLAPLENAKLPTERFWAICKLNEVEQFISTIYSDMLTLACLDSSSQHIEIFDEQLRSISTTYLGLRKAIPPTTIAISCEVKNGDTVAPSSFIGHIKQTLSETKSCEFLTNPQMAELVIDILLPTRRTYERDYTYTVSMEAILSIVEVASSREILSLTATSGKQGGTILQDAINNAYSALATNVANKMMDFFYNH